MHYEVTLKDRTIPFPLDAQKFQCEPEFVIFYARPSPEEKFQEVARFSAKNVKNIKES